MTQEERRRNNGRVSEVVGTLLDDENLETRV
jgi:hypothetical protein